MRRFTVLSAVTSAFALCLIATTSPAASADERRCYTLGVPGQDAYAVCHYLPIDPNILEP